MKSKEENKAILMLEDGTVFHGMSTGVSGTTFGEIAFNTGMTGYQEIFTDPSYFGQIVVMTTAHIGNYGVHDEEIESNSLKISGLVTKKFSETFSRPSGSSSLEDYFKRDNLVGICDVDTRALVRHIREKGAQNAVISTEIFDENELKQKLSECPSMEGQSLSQFVSMKEVQDFGTENDGYKIAMLDLGVKLNIIRCFTERNCQVRVFPLDSTIEEMKSYNPDGFMLSNGPGDPSAMPNTIELAKKLIDSDIPTFGICLGHQIIALSQGLKTEKMFNGHRGINHPVKNLATGRGEITSQNHGFVVSKDGLEGNTEVEMTHIHLNDDTVAGIKLTNKDVFSVQYHPEASAGPHDSRYLFDDFLALINKSQTEKIKEA